MHTAHGSDYAVHGVDVVADDVVNALDIDGSIGLVEGGDGFGDLNHDGATDLFSQNVYSNETDDVQDVEVQPDLLKPSSGNTSRAKTQIMESTLMSELDDAEPVTKDTSSLNGKTVDEIFSLGE